MERILPARLVRQPDPTRAASWAVRPTARHLPSNLSFVLLVGRRVHVRQPRVAEPAEAVSSPVSAAVLPQFLPPGHVITVPRQRLPIDRPVRREVGSTKRARPPAQRQAQIPNQPIRQRETTTAGSPTAAATLCSRRVFGRQ